MKVHYDLFNHLGHYRNILQFQISSRREIRWRDTWVIKVRVFRKVFSKQFFLIRYTGNFSGPLNRGGIVDLPLLRTLLAIPQKSRDPRFWEVMECKFASFKNPFPRITSLLELYYGFRIFILLVQMKKSDFCKL